MKWVHFSDIHVPAAPTLLELNVKRAFGAANYLLRRQKQFEEGVEVLESFSTFLRQHVKPDLLICSGDTTVTGSWSELFYAKEVLLQMPNTRLHEIAPLVLIPGNHDQYQEDSMLEKRFDVVFGSVTKTLPWMRTFEEADLFAVNAAVPRNNFWDSRGEISNAQLGWLEQSVSESSAAWQVMLCHYPLVTHHGTLDHKMHRMLNAEHVRGKVKGQKRVWLSGHIHRPYHVHHDLHHFCAGSLTDSRYRSFWVYDIHALTWKATQYKWQGGSFAVATELHV